VVISFFSPRALKFKAKYLKNCSRRDHHSYRVPSFPWNISYNDAVLPLLWIAACKIHLSFLPSTYGDYCYLPYYTSENLHLLKLFAPKLSSMCKIFFFIGWIFEQMKKIILIMSFIWILIFGRKMDIFHLNYGIYLS